MTRIHTSLGLAAALVALALAPGSASAATTCAHTTPGVLEVNLSAHNDLAYLQDVGPGSSACSSAGGGVTCAGTPPTQSNVDTVLIVDDSDNLATPAVGDGDTVVAINDPAYFGPGKTAEATGTSEIEFLVDTRAGTDQLSLGRQRQAAADRRQRGSRVEQRRRCRDGRHAVRQRPAVRQPVERTT